MKAKILKRGDRVRTASGTATIESNLPLVGQWEMINLEVDGAHVYYVTDQAVLVHNTCADAKILRQNLIAAGETEGKYAAHIVPTGDFSGRLQIIQAYVQFSQGVLEDVGIDLNDAENGFFTDVADHLGTHTDRFLTALAKSLSDAQGNYTEVVKVLQQMKDFAG